ncbi:DUF2339 domain-containing protein [Pseudomonas cichorii]|uniref:DUF2339 domain-containing protein n=1 Tax=Pseudomonas cichorii TaxID=36746 RepID=UPI0027E11C89|nr:DUF2339 domain-containing protein [Pseudomonas cichorii]
MLLTLLEIGLETFEYLVENPPYAWLFGLSLVLLALGIWLKQQVASLRTESVRQKEQIETLQQRLARLESPPAMPEAAQATTPLPDDTIIVAIQDSGPELLWDLPEELPAAAQPEVDIKPSAQPVARPNPLNTAFEAAKNWLLGGNTVLRVGAVVLFMGLAFLLRYATEGIVVPIEARYASVAASAMALLGLGWWLRQRNANFALMMQGTGVGVLYLTVLGAIRVHELLDPSLGFVLLVAVMLFSTMLAVTQNSLALACAATIGGFAAPILSSTGQGSHVMLFSYFALLNAGIFAIAWLKAWRLLNLIGFVGTFGIGFAWGLRSYKPELFWSVEPFLILFFLMYLAIGLLFARHKLQERNDAPDDDSRESMLRWSRRQGDYVDGTLLFGTPLAGFGLQYALTRDMEFGTAFSALALGLLYMGIARLLSGRASGRALLLVETCIALGVVFATLAIPLGLGAQWTTSAWAIEGAAIFWLGLRQQRVLARGFGLLLQVAAGLAFIHQMFEWYSLKLQGDFWTPMIIALAALLSALFVHRIKTLRYLKDNVLSGMLLVWGSLWWGLAFVIALMRFSSHTMFPTWLLLSVAASIGIWTLLALRWRWSGLAALSLWLTPVSWVLLIGAMTDTSHLFAHWAWVGWGALLAVHLFSLRRLADLLPRKAQSMAHILGCWLTLFILSVELFYGIDTLVRSNAPNSAWNTMASTLLPSLYLFAMASSRPWIWPVTAHARAYRVWAALPVALLMLAWFWLTNYYSRGYAEPLPYVPLLNPLDLGLAFALLGIVSWTRNNLPRLGITVPRAERLAVIIAGASLFALITATVLRTARHWDWYQIDLMLDQAVLSIVWTLMALALMIGGHIRRQREIWITGALLIGVVVAKLFLVELSDRGGMARIVSFIGVGVLLLVVGYFAPLPPKKPTNTTQTH